MWRVCVASIVSGDGVSLGSIFFVDLNTTALERSMLHFGRWGRREVVFLLFIPLVGLIRTVGQA